MIHTGLDRLLRETTTLAGRRYGLLAHAASVTLDCRPAHLALAESKAGPPAALFGPEHGYFGVEQDMVPSSDQTDPWTGAPIRSLYGDSEDSLRPAPEAFAGLDVLLIDLQDIGTRYYTYVATAVWAAEAALGAGVEVWVLDRPNPLGGLTLEGNLPQAGYESFVSALSLPVRHAMTMGELLQLESLRRGWDEGLWIWTMAGWRRRMLWDDNDLPWIPPSPNMPTPATAAIYPGACLIEATNFSEGRGTTRPFQLVGAPGVDPLRLHQVLERKHLPGVQLSPTYFRPVAQKHAGELCGGVEIIVRDPRVLQALRFGVELLAACHELFPDAFEWRHEPYEFVSDRPAIDLLAGGPELRRGLENGEGPAGWMAGWRGDEKAFREERRRCLLYS